MKRIFSTITVVAFWLILILLFVFVSLSNAQETKENRIEELVETRSLETGIQTEIIEEDTSIVKQNKLKKFNVSAGLGWGYGLGIKKIGKIEKINDGPTFTIRTGYSLNKYFELQGEYSRADNFKRHYRYSSYDNSYVKHNDQFLFSAYTTSLKLIIPLKIKIAPYVFGGIGRATFKFIDNTKRYDKNGILIYGNTEKMSKMGTCMKIGGGIQTEIGKKTFFFMESNYQEIKLKIEDEKITFYYYQIIGGIGLKF
ncbi:porin family protein [Patescibacteria group bacterium]|nr:porin family protein [Patescibacteria group bacterium]